MVICLERGASDLHGPADATATPSSLASSKYPDWFNFYGAGRLTEVVLGERPLDRCLSVFKGHPGA